MDTPFFYRIVSAEFVAEVLKLKDGEHKDWLVQFALDLVAGEGTTPYAKKVIAEVQEYRKRQAENGRNRWKDLNKRKDRVAKRAISEPQGSHEGCTGNSSSISSTETETKAITEAESLKSKEGRAQVKPSRSASKKKLSDEEMMQEIKSSPAYQGIDVDRELSKMQMWCQTKGKLPTMARFVNWLNRVETPLLSNGVVDTPKSYRERVNDSAVERFVKGDY